MGEQKTKKISEEEVLKDAEKLLEVQKKQKIEAEIKGEKGKKKDGPKKSKQIKAKQGKKKIRSQKYIKAKELIDRTKKYKLEEAIELAQKTSYSKFVGSIELHVRLIKSGKNPQPFRQLINLPHGTGKKINIIVLDEAKIMEIAKTKKTDFDIVLATPQLMPKTAKIAKILGPKGLMPNPKSGTITSDPEKTKKELGEGKVEIKEDSTGIIHQSVGKTDWDKDKIQDNIKTILKYIPNSKLQTVTICATMGPGIKLQI